MFLRITLFILLFFFNQGSYSQGKILSYTPDEILQNTLRWKVYCTEQKKLLESIPSKFKLFENSVENIDLNFNRSITNINIQGHLIPFISGGFHKLSVNNYDAAIFSIKFETNGNKVTIWKRPREKNDDLWTPQNKNELALESEKINKELTKKFYPHGWDELDLTLDRYSITPNDINCGFNRSVNDLKNFYNIGMKLGNINAYKIENHFIKGYVETIINDDGSFVLAILFSINNSLYDIFYHFPHNNKLDYDAVLTAIISYNLPLAEDAEFKNIEQNNNGSLESILRQLE